MVRLSRSELIFKVFAVSLVAAFSLAAFYPVFYAFSASISGKIAYESGNIVLFPRDGCSSANTLTMNWLEFGRKKLSEGPNVVCQPGRHAGCALLPLGLKPWDVSEFNA